MKIILLFIFSLNLWASVSDRQVEWKGYHSQLYTVEQDNQPERVYYLKTTLPLRDNYPSGQEVQITENENKPYIRSGNQIFDALFALALQEVNANSVSQIHNYNFISSPCDCFETGQKWNYVWTRDTAYSTHLSLGLIDPTRSKNSLEFKLSPLRNGEKLEIVQDTGSGGSWPISTDRVIWALGAWETLKYLDGLERQQFLEKSFQAISNTIARDRKVIFDSKDGLYRGEQSFLDWREQTYPSWITNRMVDLATSKSLSTNAAHYIILTVGAQMAELQNKAELKLRWESYAKQLKKSINDTFWLDEQGLYSTMLTTSLDSIPLKKYDLLGESLAILSGIASKEQAEMIVANYPNTNAGAPVIWPQQPNIPIYHNRAIWPFVSAYYLKAAKAVSNDQVINRNVISMITATALNLSNMENYEFLTLANWYQDQGLSGPIVNSHRQLWSVAGYLSMVLDIFFGLESAVDGIRWQPLITKYFRNVIFKNGLQLELKNLLYRGKKIDITINLPNVNSETSGNYVAEEVFVNNKRYLPATWIQNDDLLSKNQIIINLQDQNSKNSSINHIKIDDPNALKTDEGELLWAPVEPQIQNFTVNKEGLKLEFSSAQDGRINYNIYKNNQPIAKNLVTSSWTDDRFDSSVTSCYSVEAVFKSSGNTSHHSKPICYWAFGTGLTLNVDDSSFITIPYRQLSYDHGRAHFADWGHQNERIVLRDLQVAKSGNYLVSLTYANAFNSISSGITAANKVIEVYAEGDDLPLYSQVITMPHLSSWDQWGNSTHLEARLLKGTNYQLEIFDYFNMSYLSHFFNYLETGGIDGAVNRINFSAIELNYAPSL